jgi:sulfite exporter TauE/SafE
MLALIGAVFLASLLGSLHCAGMCGAFVVFAVSADPRSKAPRLPLHVAYHGGRLGTYVAFGMVAGTVGAALDLSGSLVGVQRLAAMLAGGMMVGFGLIVLLREAGVGVPKAPIPKAMRDAAIAGHRVAQGQAPIVRALLTGLLTTFLPCGWLYAFVIVAAGTADPAMGAVTMAAFWLGTVPVLAAIGAGVQRLLGSLGRFAPTIAASAVIVVGALTVADRSSLVGTMAGPAQIPVSESLVDHALGLDSADAACCAPAERTDDASH